MNLAHYVLILFFLSLFFYMKKKKHTYNNIDILYFFNLYEPI